MEIREQLRGLLGYRERRRSPLPGPRISHTGGLSVEEVIPGQLVEGEAGTFFLAERCYPAGSIYAGIPLSSVLEYSSWSLAQLARDQALEDTDPEAILYLDTETTGLSGGTGTYVFLVGVGQFVGGDFHLHQFFMPGPQEEEAMLIALEEKLAPFQAVASFNGRAFDLPLLQTRFLYARRRPPLEDAAHLDLLFPARRLWRECVGSCALGALEENILGLKRSREDVPSWLVPRLYFDYLRTGDARPLRGLFYHNEQDVLSLVALLARMCRLLEAPPAALAASGPELYGLARLYEERRLFPRSVEGYRRALDHALPAHLEEATLRRLSFLLKRLGRMEEAVEIWWRVAEDARFPVLYPYVELAKYYEHRQRQYFRAEELTLRAIRLVEGLPLGRERKERRLGELSHRLRRVRRKGRALARSGPERK